MKTLYITAFFLLSFNIYAQENNNSEQQDQIEHIKKSKEFETKMMKEAQERLSEKKSAPLASEEGLEVTQQQQTQSSANSGKLLPNTASLEEVLASIPGRQSRKNKITSEKSTVVGIPNTATLEEIKKSIPKN